MLDLSPTFQPENIPIPHPLKALFNWRKDRREWYLFSYWSGRQYSIQAAKVLLGAPIP